MEQRGFGPDLTKNFDGLKIQLFVGPDEFRIEDNCGGFDIETAKDYAFRFGRAKQGSTDSLFHWAVRRRHEAGTFQVWSGVRNSFLDRSGTLVDRRKPWTIGRRRTSGRSTSSMLTEIWTSLRRTKAPPSRLKRLRPEVSSRFGTRWFQNTLGDVIRRPSTSVHIERTRNKDSRASP